MTSLISTQRTLIGGLMLAAALVIGQASPAAAAELPDVAMASLTAGTYGRGLIMVRYSGTDNVNSLFWQGLVENESFRIVGRSIGCKGTPSRSNRVFRVRDMTDDEGTFNVVATRSINAVIKSFWLGTVGEPALCVPSHNYDALATAGDWDSDARTGLTKEGAGTLAALASATRMSHDRARISVAIDGDGDTDASDFLVLFAKGRCGHAVRSVRAQIRLPADSAGRFKSKVVSMTQELLDTTRSVRIVDAKTGEKFGCVPLNIIMANTEGDW